MVKPPKKIKYIHGEHCPGQGWQFTGQGPSGRDYFCEVTNRKVTDDCCGTTFPDKHDV